MSYMEIQTKYKIGEILWTMDNNKAVSFKVTGICVTVDTVDDTHNAMNIEYRGLVVDYHGECDCYATKEELINSL